MNTIKLLYYKVINHPILRHKQIFWALKLSIISLLLYSIYRRLIAKGDIVELSKEFIANLGFPNLFFGIGVLLLIPVVILLETNIWQTVIEKVEPGVSFKKVLKSVIVGFSLYVFSPNGVAKTLAPLMVIKTKSKSNLLAAISVSEIAKQVVVFAVGSFLGAFILQQFFDFDKNTLTLLTIGGFILAAFYVLFYFNVSYVVVLCRRIKFLKPIVKHILVLEQFDNKELLKPLLYSFVRYFFTLFQYYLLLRYFGIEVPFIIAIAAVATMYAIRTVFFLPPSLSIFFRTELAIMFWGVYSENMVGIIAIEVTLWLINVVIPALVGAIYISRTNLRETLLLQVNKAKNNK